MQFKTIFFILVLCSSTTACLRYTPSRAELKDSGEVSQYSNTLGSKELYAYEERLDSELNKLIARRSGLLSAGADKSYRFGPGDTIKVDIFNFEDISSEVEISEDGSADLPLVGRVNFDGKSLNEVRQELTGRYKKYIKAPHIVVSKNKATSNQVYIVGEVGKPGAYPLRHVGQLLSEVLAEAGGLTEKASSRVILSPASNTLAAGNVSRLAQSATGGVEINFEDLHGSLDKAPLLVPLKPGDRIVIPKVGKFQVDGEVNKPGEHVLASRTSVLGAIAASGGLTYSANVEEVEVIREIGAGRKAVVGLNLEDVAAGKVDDVPLRDGDVVRVPSEPGRFARRQVIEFFNGLFRGVGMNR